MRARHLILLSVTIAGCSSLTDTDGSAIEYRGPIAGSFAERTPPPHPGAPDCTTYSTLSGTVRVKLARPGEIAGADAGIDLTERVVGASPGCGSSREVRPFGEWTAPVTGTPSQLGFTIARSSSGQTTTINFSGSLTNNTIIGTLTYSRVLGATSGSTSFNVSMPIAQSQEFGVSGTWTGMLSIVQGGHTLTKATTLALTQTGSNVTGQLQFDGDEVLNVDGTVAGATLAIRATPLQVGDGCDRHSFGLTFTVSTSLHATSAIGIGCEDGGQLLQEISSAAGVLNR